jgi:hypothetical protein
MNNPDHMNKPIYRLVVRFPGIIQPTYSKKEYQAAIKSEGRLLNGLFIGLCVGSLAIAVLAFLIYLEAVK